MYLIFPWVYRSPWSVLLFSIACAVCFAFSGGSDVSYAIEPMTVAAIVGTTGMLIAGAMTSSGMTRAAQTQAQAAKDVAAMQIAAAKAAANTPLAKARERMVMEALNRFEDDDYLGISAAQKRDIMRRALFGYDALTRGTEITLRRHIGQVGFGRSGMEQEAIADIQEGKKDVSAKTSVSAEQLSEQSKQIKKAADKALITGAPDPTAAMYQQIGEAGAQQAHQQGQIASQMIAGKTAGGAGLGHGLSTWSPSQYYQPWYTQLGSGDKPGPADAAGAYGQRMQIPAQYQVQGNQALMAPVTQYGAG